MSKLLILLLTFGVVAIAGQIAIGQQNKSQMRLWKDVTGQHSITAEFVDLGNGVVRLKTTNGRMRAVPLVRLSLTDRQYVLRRTSAENPSQEASSGSVKPEPKLEYGAKHEDQPEKARCTFQITGLMHRRVQQSLPIAGRQFRYDVLTLCGECWSKIVKLDEFGSFRRHITTRSFSAGRDARQTPMIFMTDYHFPLNTDLGPIAKAVVEAKLTHESKRAFFVLFEADLNKRSLEAAIGTLRVTPGVVAAGTSYDAQGKVLRVEISGKASVTVPGLMASLQGAGANVRLPKRLPRLTPVRGQMGQGRVPQGIGGGRP